MRRKNRRGWQYINIIFGKVDARFQFGNQIDERLLNGPDTARERAVELLGGNLRLIQRLRVDQIAHGLGLRQVEPASKKCPLGKFAGPRQTRSRSNAGTHQEFQNHRRAMRGKLDYIFAGVGMWRGKPGDDGLVESCSGSRVEKFGKARLRRSQRVTQAQQRRSDSHSLRPA